MKAPTFKSASMRPDQALALSVQEFFRFDWGREVRDGMNKLRELLGKEACNDSGDSDDSDDSDEEVEICTNVWLTLSDSDFAEQYLASGGFKALTSTVLGQEDTEGENDEYSMFVSGGDAARGVTLKFAPETEGEQLARLISESEGGKLIAFVYDASSSRLENGVYVDEE
jgi:hypothetical protein